MFTCTEVVYLTDFLLFSVVSLWLFFVLLMGSIDFSGHSLQPGSLRYVSSHGFSLSSVDAETTEDFSTVLWRVYALASSIFFRIHLIIAALSIWVISSAKRQGDLTDGVG